MIVGFLVVQLESRGCQLGTLTLTALSLVCDVVYSHVGKEGLRVKVDLLTNFCCGGTGEFADPLIIVVAMYQK
jgi:hypothetical protein